MIELIEGLPDGVVGIEAVGEVTADDYVHVAFPAVERALESHQKIRLIHVLGERLEGHTPGAMWDDTKLGLSHLRSFERIAVVTDIGRVRAVVNTAAWSVPGEMRLFSNAERSAAVAWVSDGLETAVLPDSIATEAPNEGQVRIGSSTSALENGLLRGGGED